MKKRSIKIFLITFILLNLFLITGCSFNKKININETQILRIGFEKKCEKVNPFFIETELEDKICSFVFSKTTELMESKTIIYYEGDNIVSESDYKEENKLTYEITIKQNMLFSDGSLITIEDVLFNLYYYLNPNYIGNNYLNKCLVIEIKKIDDYKMSITFSKYNRLIEEALSFYVAPKNYYIFGYKTFAIEELKNFSEEEYKDFQAHLQLDNNSPCGSGAYKIIFPLRNDLEENSIEFTRNENYQTINGNNASVKYLSIYMNIKNIQERINNGSLDFGVASIENTNYSTLLASKEKCNYTFSKETINGVVSFNPLVLPNMNERKALLTVMNYALLNEQFPELALRPMTNASYDGTLESSIQYFIQAGYHLNEQGSFDNPPIYVFAVSSNNNPMNVLFNNMKTLLEPLGIRIEIEYQDFNHAEDYKPYAVYGMEYKTEEYKNAAYVTERIGLNYIEEDFIIEFVNEEFTNPVIVDSIEYKTEYEMVKGLENKINDYYHTKKNSSITPINELLDNLTIEQVVYLENYFYIYSKEVDSSAISLESGVVDYTKLCFLKD